MPARAELESIEAVGAGLARAGYISSPRTATAIYLAHHLHKPVLVEGPAGVGKTELAKAMAASFGLPLVRLQCYEGLDESKALYEWKYGKQLLYTQLLKDHLGERLRHAATLDSALHELEDVDDAFFSERFLEARPLLRALQAPGGAVLLVDEVDKADPEFEAFLLELLSDYQVTIPELGTVVATVPPVVVLTSKCDSRARRSAQTALPAPAHRLSRCAARGADRRRSRSRSRRAAAQKIGRIRARLA